jgi:RNA polymerase sigma factor (sigma-70 family)
MRCNEEMAGRETKVAAVPNDGALAGQERGAREVRPGPGNRSFAAQPRRYAQSLTRDVAAGDDLVRECVARALAKLHLWTAGTDLRAWLFTIMRNQYVSQVRRASREGAMVEWSDCSPTLTCAPRQIGQLELRDLERAITLLPEEQRTAVLFVGLTGRTYDEIASDCVVPVGTVRSRLSRGRRALRELTGVSPSQQSIAGGLPDISQNPYRGQIVKSDPRLPILR